MAKKQRLRKKIVHTPRAARGDLLPRVNAFAEQNLTRFYICFFLLALLIRVSYVLSLRHLPLFDALVMDPAYHEKIALLVYNGDWLAGDEPYYRSPLYMYVLALLYKLFEPGYLVPRLFGALTGSISVLLMMRIGNILFGALPAVIAGFIAVFCWPLIYFDGELLTTSFTVMMGLILLLIFIRAWLHPSAANMAGLGLFFGITAITRENYLPIILLVFLFFIIMRRQLLQPALFFAAALLAIAPVTARNYVVLDDFVPITHYTAVNFYIGNNPYSDGRTAILPYTRADWYGGVEDVGKVVEKHIGHPPKPSEISAFWGKETFKYIFNDFFTCDPETMTPTPTLYDEPSPPPVDGKCRAFLPTAIKKFFFVFDLREYSNNKEMYFFRDLSSVLGLPLFHPFAAFLYIPLGLLGILLAIIARNKKAVPLYVILVGYLIGLSLGFVNSRIRMPIMVMFIIFTGYAITRLWAERRQLWPRIGGLAAVIALLLIINAPKPGHRERATLAGHFMMGNAYLRKGDLDIAEQHYRESVKLTVGEYQMRTLAGLSELEMRRGFAAVQTQNMSLAFEHFRKSTDYQENYAAWINMGNIVSGEGGDPMPYFQRALALQPNAPDTHVSMAQHFLGVGALDEARAHLARGKSLTDGSDPRIMEFITRLEQELAQ